MGVIACLIVCSRSRFPHLICVVTVFVGGSVFVFSFYLHIFVYICFKIFPRFSYFISFAPFILFPLFFPYHLLPPLTIIPSVRACFCLVFVSVEVTPCEAGPPRDDAAAQNKPDNRDEEVEWERLRRLIGLATKSL